MSKYEKITANSGLISFGNTGARLGDPRATYVKILTALNKFRERNANWKDKDQVEFGELLSELEIFEIKTDNIVSSDKDVRLKTSFISQLGFTTNDRIVTKAGEELLQNSKNFATNEFEISNESFTYFKQFLKYQQKEFEILPLLSLIYAIVEFDNELPLDFVTYIWSSSQTKSELIQNIKTYKKNSDYKETVYKSIVNSENTELAIKNINIFFANHYTIFDKNELIELLYVIFPHGRGKKFKNKTITLFYDIHSYWLNKNKLTKTEKKSFIQNNLRSRHKDIACKKSSDYLLTLFGTTSISNSSDWEKIISFFENTELISAKDEETFILNFHILYMYIKKISVCEEYKDLNIRHLKLLDVFIFEYNNIKLDIVFWYLFKSVKDSLLEVKPLLRNDYIKKLESSQTSISQIYDFLQIDILKLSEQIATDFPEIKKLGLQNFALKKKEERLLNLVNTVFTKEKLIAIFENIYPRNDKKIRELIKEWYQDYEATIPALFEYLLGIAFYWLFQKQVRISDILNLGLDANLLPKTHAAGGQADLIISRKEKDYLIEATLSENDNQRQMEAEPVPRHLAKHILEKNQNSLALFIAGKLDPNNLVALRNYKFSTWYNFDGRSVENMNILPLAISNVIYLLKQEVYDLDELESNFEKLLNSKTTDGFKWYTNEINLIFS